MFKDRAVLIEKEINKLKAHCSDLYRLSVVEGAPIDLAEYTTCLEKLSTMMTELIVINEMIDQGNE